MPTILVVDDEVGIQDVLRFLLEDEGYEVLQAKTLAEAREVFDSQKSKIDAILLDGIMDSGNTTDLLLNYMVKESEFSKPVIAFSGDEKTRKKQVKLGCLDELDKASTADEISNFFKVLFQK